MLDSASRKTASGQSREIGGKQPDRRELAENRLETRPDAIGGLHRELVADDGAQQGDKRIAPGDQCRAGKAVDQILRRGAALLLSSRHD